MAIKMVTAGVLAVLTAQVPWPHPFAIMVVLEICQDTGADSWRQKYPACNIPFSKWILLQLKAHPSLET